MHRQQMELASGYRFGMDGFSVHMDVMNTCMALTAAHFSTFQLTSESQPHRKTKIKVMETLGPDTSIEQLIDTIANGPSEFRESALKLLAPMCIDTRKRVYAQDKIPVLVEVVKFASSFYSQLYAFDAVSWAAEDNGGMSKEEMLELRSAVRDPTPEELAALSESLDNGTGKEKNDAALICGCLGTLASYGHFSTEISIYFVGSLASALEEKKGNQERKLWVTYSLSNLASCEVYRMTIMGQCFRDLIALVRNGSEGQRQWAALALGNLTDSYHVQAELCVEGGIPALVGLSRSEVPDHQWAAAYALAAAAVLDDNRHKIARKQGIPPLVTMVKSGSAKHKRWAAHALGTIAADHDANREEMEKEGVIPALVSMVQSGSEDEQLWGAYALGNIACDSSAVKDAMHNSGVTAALAGLETSPFEVVQDAGALARAKVRQYGKVRQFFRNLGVM